MIRFFFYVCLCAFAFLRGNEVCGQTLTTSNLPIVIIQTDGNANIPDDPKVNASMKIIDNGPGNSNAVTDVPNDFDGRIGIETRGSSSQFFFPKKQYGIEVRDIAGNDSSASLLGLPTEEDWILFAPYNDKTLMRDVLAYQLGRDLGQYASRSKYCEVIVNGQYLGVYVLLEKIKRNKARVDISKLTTTDNSGDDVTGGYILKIDKFTGSGGQGFNSNFRAPFGNSNQTTWFQYEYPDPSDITPSQANYITNYVRNFETALASASFKDESLGYRPFIDVKSFIDFMIINELTKNVDGYRLSTYFHKKKSNDGGGKLHMGPIWDFNLGFGNADYCTKGNPEGLVLDFNQLCPSDGMLIPFWWKRLLEDPSYRKELGTRWSELRQNVLSTQRIHTYIDSVANVLTEARARNFSKWPVIGTYVWPNYYVGQSYQQEVDWLKNFVKKRAAWLDDQWLDYVTPVEGPIEVQFTVKTSPNPLTRSVTVSGIAPPDRKVDVQLLDATGRLIAGATAHGTHEYSHTFDVSAGADGLYFVRVTCGTEVRVQKVIKSGSL